MSPTTPFSTLARAMARGTRPSDLLPELHRELLAALGAARSVVLASSPVSNDYIASSGRGFDGVGTAWVRDSEAQELSRIAAPGPAVVTLSTLPSLEARLQSRRALLIPVKLAKRPTILV